MQYRRKVLLSLLASLLIVIPLYIILHESGHALISVLCGAKILDFSILKAHIVTEGGVYNQFTSSLMNAAGVLLPVVVAFVSVLLYHKENESVLYRILSFYLWLVSISSTLAWIIIPVIYMFGNAPVNEDVTKFLYNSGISPIWVMISTLLVQTTLLLLALNKKMIQNYQFVIKSISNKSSQFKDNNHRERALKRKD